MTKTFEQMNPRWGSVWVGLKKERVFKGHGGLDNLWVGNNHGQNEEVDQVELSQKREEGTKVYSKLQKRGWNGGKWVMVLRRMGPTPACLLLPPLDGPLHLLLAAPNFA